MCGIYGEVGEPGDPSVGRELDRAVDALAHRGPDDRGCFRGDGIALGMRRLSILDLAHGQQPLWSQSGVTGIVYNGELYNYRELRRELEAEGHRFRTASDTEVVLAVLDRWGIDGLGRMNGMFALARWDARERSLLLARDRLGEKPLYYTRLGSRLRFASEMKALLADGEVPRTLSHRGLANYLAFGHALAPRTILEGVVKLEAGHYLEARGGEVRVARWWEVGQEPPFAPGEVPSEDEAARRVRDLLDDAVRLRLVADVPVGAFLSGGLDSSAIVALMRRHTTGPVKTFALGFRSGGAYDETGAARRVAQALGTDHHELRLDAVDLVATLETLVHHYDEPFADPAGFPVYLLSRFAREQVKVVLTGDGGDELFGGYRRYATDAMLATPWSRLPRSLSERWLPALASRLPRLRRAKRALRVLAMRDPARRYPAWLDVFSPELQQELLLPAVHDGIAGHDPAADLVRYYRSRPHDDHVNRMLYTDVMTWLPDAYLEKTDKATMAASLEARLPLLDHRLVELAFALPGRYKVRGFSLKRLLKRAVHDLVPEFVLRRPKHGFAVPIDPWFRGDLQRFTFATLLDGSARTRGLFDLAFVERLWREHRAGKNVWDLQLWSLLNLEIWFRQVMDGGR